MAGQVSPANHYEADIFVSDIDLRIRVKRVIPSVNVIVSESGCAHSSPWKPKCLFNANNNGI